MFLDAEFISTVLIITQQIQQSVACAHSATKGVFQLGNNSVFVLKHS